MTVRLRHISHWAQFFFFSSSSFFFFLARLSLIALGEKKISTSSYSDSFFHFLPPHPLHRNFTSTKSGERSGDWKCRSAPPPAPSIHPPSRLPPGPLEMYLLSPSHVTSHAVSVSPTACLSAALKQTAASRRFGIGERLRIDVLARGDAFSPHTLSVATTPVRCAFFLHNKIAPA